MYHYLFTNDLRISTLDRSLKEAADCFVKDCVPSAKEDKNASNNMNTLCFYFNLTKNSKCSLECAQGNIRKVVLNFIKKFQFPNPRTTNSLKNAIKDNIQIAPMRIIVQTLYIMMIIDPNRAFLFNSEIAEHIFFNDSIAKNQNPDIVNLAKIIINSNNRTDTSIPDDAVLNQKGIYWNQCKRQIREMVNVLCWSGCIEKDKNGAIRIRYNNLSRDNEADLFEIITYNKFWHYDSTKNEASNKLEYQSYMDIDSATETSSTVQLSPLNFKTKVSSDFQLNRIIFGAPGTGKSFRLNREAAELLIGNEGNYERVTFHPDYSYANFVGTYKPVMVTIHSDDQPDDETRVVLKELKDEDNTPQQKYSILYDKFKGQFPELPILMGIATGKHIDVVNKYPDSVTYESETGIALRKYVRLIDDEAKQSADISYEYVPGPFMRVYVKAMKSAQSDNPQPYLLIIEEINRANVAAVFGDIFQLLDRVDNVSEYPIQASEDIRKYLAKELGGNPDDWSSIRIPDNMFIWATMNSADQGVFPMDTAFKRRWDFTYLGIDDNDEEIKEKYVVFEKKDKSRWMFEWNELRKAINDFLAAEGINEDKQLGPYFISRRIIVPDNGDVIDADKFREVFKHKVIMYLFEDAAKQKRRKLLSGCGEDANRYSKICEKFDEHWLNIFDDSVTGKVKIAPYSEDPIDLADTADGSEEEEQTV